MTPLSETAFLDALGTLDPPEFRAFVAAVWRARGAEVALGSPTLQARRRGETKTIAPVLVPRWGSVAAAIPDGTDVVVTDAADPGGLPDDVRVVDGPALYELLVYGIDRGAADDLCQEFLDRPIAATDHTSDRGRRRAALVALLAAVAVLSVVAAAPGVDPGLDAGALQSTDRPPTTFGTPVEDLPYSRMWPADERSPSGPGRQCFEPAVEDLPYTEMRPDTDDLDGSPGTTDLTTATAENGGRCEG